MYVCISVSFSLAASVCFSFGYVVFWGVVVG